MIEKREKKRTKVVNLKNLHGYDLLPKRSYSGRAVVPSASGSESTITEHLSSEMMLRCTVGRAEISNSAPLPSIVGNVQQGVMSGTPNEILAGVSRDAEILETVLRLRLGSRTEAVASQGTETAVSSGMPKIQVSCIPTPSNTLTTLGEGERVNNAVRAALGELRSATEVAVAEQQRLTEQALQRDALVQQQHALVSEGNAEEISVQQVINRAEYTQEAISSSAVTPNHRILMEQVAESAASSVTVTEAMNSRSTFHYLGDFIFSNIRTALLLGAVATATVVAVRVTNALTSTPESGSATPPSGVVSSSGTPPSEEGGFFWVHIKKAFGNMYRKVTEVLAKGKAKK